MGLYYISLVLLFFFVGFRYEVGCDWSGYEHIFEIQRYASIDEAVQRSEPAFWAINALLHLYELDYPSINVIASAAFFLGLHALARRQPDPLGFLILSYPIFIINLAMSGIRQAIAVGFLCVAFNAFVDKRLARYVCLVIFATGFHSSALSFIMLAPLARGELSSRTIALAAILLLPGGYFLISGEAFEMYSQRYIGTGVDSVGAPFRAGLLALTGAAFLWFLSTRWKAQSREDHKLVTLSSYMMMAVFPVAFLSSVIGDRFGYYLYPVQLAILARLPYLAWARHSIMVSFSPYLAGGLVLLIWTQLSTLFVLCYVPYKIWW